MHAETSHAADDSMSPARRSVLSAFFALLILGHGYEIAARSEHWPFSNYPMYAGLASDRVSRKVIVGVLPDGREIPLEINRDLSPFDNTRFYSAMHRVSAERGPAAYAHALKQLLLRYEQLRVRGDHQGPAIVALRAYEMRWPVLPGASNKDHPSSRKRLVEARLGGAAEAVR